MGKMLKRCIENRIGREISVFPNTSRNFGYASDRDRYRLIEELIIFNLQLFL